MGATLKNWLLKGLISSIMISNTEWIGNKHGALGIPSGMISKMTTQGVDPITL